MGNLNILLGLDLQAPASALDAEARVILVLDPLLQRLAEWSQIRASLHINGPMLLHVVESHPRTLKTLVALLKTRRVELLGGGFHDPFLGAIPEHDATGQIHLMNGLLSRTLGYQPRGVWLRGSAWSPALPALLNRCGFAYTLLDESLLEGRCQKEGDGYHIAERDGFTVAVYPIDQFLQERLFAGTEPVDLVLQGFAEGQRPRTAVLAVEDLGNPDDLRQVMGLLNRLRGHAEWIKTSTFSDHMAQQPPVGRTYPTAPFSSIVATEGLVDWERFATAYPEVNFLHKRMLMASYQVHRVRRQVQAQLRAKPDAPNAGQLRAAIEEACTHLWQAQNHRVYWHGDHHGLYDARERRAAYSHVLTAERLATELARGKNKPAPKFEVRSVDFDCDGRQELLVDAGQLGAILSPHRGGGLMTLELKDRDVALGSVLRRHAESYHLEPTSTDIQLVGVDGGESYDDDEITATVSARVTLDEETRPWVDSRARLSFMDHFLGPGTTAENWARNCYREVGDFLDAPYELIRERDDHPDDTGVLLLGRNGTVQTESGRSLVRVEKKFLFSTVMPRVRVEYKLINRYFEPAPAWFGVEANFALFGGDGAAAGFRAMCASADVEGSVASPRALQRVGYLELIDEQADLVLCLYLEEAMDVWLAPVQTVTRSREGIEKLQQGVSVLVHGVQDLWGSEESPIQFRIEFVRP